MVTDNGVRRLSNEVAARSEGKTPASSRAFSCYQSRRDGGTIRAVKAENTNRTDLARSVGENRDWIGRPWHCLLYVGGFAILRASEYIAQGRPS